MPDIIQLIFNKIAKCEVLDCMKMGDSNDIDYCCRKEEKMIDVSRSGRIDFLSIDQSIVLYSLCSNVFSIVDGLMDNKRPTSRSPTKMPVSDYIDASLAPSESPTMGWVPIIISSVEKSVAGQEQNQIKITNTSVTRSPVIKVLVSSFVLAFLIITLIYTGKFRREKEDIENDGIEIEEAIDKIESSSILQTPSKIPNSFSCNDASSESVIISVDKGSNVDDNSRKNDNTGSREGCDKDSFLCILSTSLALLWSVTFAFWKSRAK